MRYRCRVGHAYTADDVLEGKDGRMEDALYTALNTLEAPTCPTSSPPAPASTPPPASKRKQGARRRAETIRRLLVEQTDGEG